MSKFMQKTVLIRIALAILLLVFLGFAIGQAREQKQLQLRDSIELKSREAQLIELDNKYSDLLKDKSQTVEEKSKRIKELEKEKAELEKQVRAKQNTPSELQRTATSTLNALTGTNTAHAQSKGSCDTWMSKAGIPKTQATMALIAGESGCRVNATNPSSGAYGIPQALPGHKMASAGDDWRTNPVTQLRWMDSYIKGRYGSWDNAYATWLSRSPHWY